MALKISALRKWSDSAQLNWYGRGMRRIGNWERNNKILRLENIPATAGIVSAIDAHYVNYVIGIIAPHLQHFPVGVDIIAGLAVFATVVLNLSARAARKNNLIAAPAVPIALAISAPQAAVPAPIIPPPAPGPSAAFDPTVASVPPARPAAPGATIAAKPSAMPPAQISLTEHQRIVAEQDALLRKEQNSGTDAVRKLNKLVEENERLKAEIAKLKLIQPPAPKPAVPKESEPIEDLSAADIEIIPASKLAELKAAITDQALLDQIVGLESENNFEELLKVLENIKAEGAISETVLAAAQDEVIDKI
jgi:hypothetical protein